MATNKRIQELTAAATLDDTDLALIGQGTNARQVALSVLGSYMGTSGITGAQIKTLYEGEADTNEYDDAEQTKLAGI